MYRCRITGTDNIHQYEELIKIFLPPHQFEIVDSDVENCRHFIYNGDKNLLKRQMYDSLREYSGKSPKWGIVTGIRPVKMAGELLARALKAADINSSSQVQSLRKEDSSAEIKATAQAKTEAAVAQVKDTLENEFLMHSEKSELTLEILKYQRQTAGLPEKKSFSLYIGIPFCPTRCLYCSFTSNQVAKEEIDRYLQALIKEMNYVARATKEKDLRPESLYIGGGTPTTLDERQLELLLKNVAENFSIKELKEFTLEAGRPDTLTAEKLAIMRDYGVDRISINPQTMKQSTLELIGRKHSVDDVVRAFGMAKEAGFEVINTDLIAGLPLESFEDFRNSLERILEFDAANVTLHTLAVKRASRLKEMDEEYNYRNESLREKMLSYAHRRSRNEGYRPYYLYRQKHTSGNTENIGFCRNDKVSLYNIRIMEEAQSILALGAGGISKIYFADENRLERIPNVSNYEIYIERVEEMIARKQENFFDEVL